MIYIHQNVVLIVSGVSTFCIAAVVKTFFSTGCSISESLLLMLFLLDFFWKSECHGCSANIYFVVGCFLKKSTVIRVCFHYCTMDEPWEYIYITHCGTF